MSRQLFLPLDEQNSYDLEVYAFLWLRAHPVDRLCIPTQWPRLETQRESVSGDRSEFLFAYAFFASESGLRRPQIEVEHRREE